MKYKTPNQKPKIEPKGSSNINVNSLNKKSTLSTYLILFCLPVFLYIQSVSFGFTYFDDNTLLSNNLPFLSELHNIPQAFTRPAFNSPESHFYRPLQTVSYMLDIKLSGGDNAWMYHLTNVLLLGFISCLLFQLLRMFQIPFMLALLSTLIYVTHPLFVSSVAWIPARGDLQLLLFSLLSFLLLIEYLQQKKTSYLLGHWITFTLALFCKETAVLLPLLFILYYYFFRTDKKSNKNLYLPIMLYAVSGIGWLWLHTKAIGGGSNQHGVFGLFSQTNDVGILPILGNLQTIPECLVNFFIPVDVDAIPSFSLFKTLLGIGFMLLIGVLFLRNKERSASEKLFALLWFILLLLPTMLFKHNQIEYLHHRFFLPLIGILLFMLFIIPSKWMVKNTIKNGWILVIVLVVLSFTSYAKSRSYKDQLTYFSSAVKDNPNAVFGQFNLGIISADKGLQEDAFIAFTKAIELKPDYAEAYNNRGLIYEQRGKLVEAIVDFSKAIESKPDFEQAYYNRAILFETNGLKEEAIANYTKAIALKPDYVKAYNNRGNIFNKQKKYEKALRDFSKTIELNPTYAEGYNNIGTVYQNQGIYNEAIANYSKAIALKPDYVDAFFNRGNIYSFQRMYDKAIFDYSKIIELKPQLASIYNSRGIAFLNQGNTEKACSDFRKAEELGLSEGKVNVMKFCK